ncbi:MAG: hypothetical protein LBT01_03015 [Spirochaetaceae bacterium]|jgi:hypothetical protein|nr:hypothetical protein [Spirochaetaceae bacterium]
MLKKKQPKSKAKTLVKIACIVGIFALLAFLGALVFSLLQTNTSFFGDKNQLNFSAFHEKLQSFDALFAGVLNGANPPNVDFFNTTLDALEKTAVGAEAQLSVLKRRRRLAREFPAFTASYLQAAERAVAAFPHSAPVAALVGGATGSASLVLDTGARQKLNAYAKLLSESGPLGEKSFLPLALAFYSLADSFSSLEAASQIKHAPRLLAAAAENLVNEPFEGLSIDAALLNIIEDNQTEANAALVMLRPNSALTRKATRFFAQYAYDFGKLLLAAELWTKAGGAEDLARAADALYLAGLTPNARQMWTMLTADEGALTPRPIRLQSFYNLAITAGQDDDKAAPLENLRSESDGIESPPEFYGVILWTRLLPDEKARSLLRETQQVSENTLLDLELFRRSLSATPLERSIADTWFLLERHSDDERIYRWAAWYFAYEKRLDETDFLIKRAEKMRSGGEWIPLNRALLQIRAGDYAGAATALEAAAPSAQGWVIPANLGLIREAEHNFQSALAHFTRAAAEIENRRAPEKAALLQLKIARCLSILGRKDEARAAVLKAATLDGENVNVRIALGRLN